MKGITGKMLIEVFIILATIFALVLGLPVVLNAIGMTEWSELVRKVQDIEKYDDEGITFSLPQYIERIEFIQGSEEQLCETPKLPGIPQDLLVSVCTLCKKLEGNTFIVIKIDQQSKPSIGSVWWKLITLRFKNAKSDAVKMGLTDICYPKDFVSNFQNSKFIEPNYRGFVMVLPGDRNEVKKYCVTPVKKTNQVDINVKEGECR